MPFAVRLKGSAKKSLRRLPPRVQKQAAVELRALREEWHPAGAQKVKGTDDLWRLRFCGDYRIIYSKPDSDQVILVAVIDHRSSCYDGF